jgi:hypothetical protein
MDWEIIYFIPMDVKNYPSYMHLLISWTQQALFIGHIANDNNAPEIKLTEEQIREKYPWDTKELTILDLKQIDDKTFNPWVFDCISAQTQYEVTGK